MFEREFKKNLLKKLCKTAVSSALTSVPGVDYRIEIEIENWKNKIECELYFASRRRDRWRGCSRCTTNRCTRSTTLDICRCLRIPRQIEVKRTTFEVGRSGVLAIGDASEAAATLAISFIICLKKQNKTKRWPAAAWTSEIFDAVSGAIRNIDLE